MARRGRSTADTEGKYTRRAPETVQDLIDAMRHRLKVPPMRQPNGQLDAPASPDQQLQVLIDYYLPAQMTGSLKYNVRQAIALSIIGLLNGRKVRDAFRKRIVEKLGAQLWEGGKLKPHDAKSIPPGLRETFAAHHQDMSYFTSSGVFGYDSIVGLLDGTELPASQFLRNLLPFPSRLSHADLCAINNAFALPSVKKLFVVPMDITFLDHLTRPFPNTITEVYEHHRRPRLVLKDTKLNKIFTTLARELIDKEIAETSPETYVERFKHFQSKYQIYFVLTTPPDVLDLVSLIVQVADPKCLQRIFINRPYVIDMERGEFSIVVPQRHIPRIEEEIRSLVEVRDILRFIYLTVPMNSLALYDLANHRWGFNRALLLGDLSDAAERFRPTSKKLRPPKISASERLNLDYLKMFTFQRYYPTGFKSVTSLLDYCQINRGTYDKILSDLVAQAPVGYMPVARKLGQAESGWIHVEGTERWKGDLLLHITRHFPVRMLFVFNGRHGGRFSCMYYVPFGMSLQFSKFYKRYLPRFFPDAQFHIQATCRGQYQGVHAFVEQWDDGEGYYRDEFEMGLRY